MTVTERTAQELQNEAARGGVDPVADNAGATVISPVQPANSRRMRKRHMLMGVLVVLIVAGLAAGLSYYLQWRAWQTTDDAAIDGHIVPISPQVAGPVVAVYVDDNQVVKKGDLLVQIDPRDFEARLAAAKATLAAAEAKQQAAGANVALIRTTSGAGVDEATAGVEIARSAVTAARTQVTAAQSGVAQAKAQVASADAAVNQAKAEIGVAQAEVTRADTELKRFEALRASRAATPEEYTNAEAASRSAHAKLAAAEGLLQARQAAAIAARAAQDTANATSRQAEAMLVQTQSQVGKAEATLAGAKGAPQQVAQAQAHAQSAAADIEQAKAMVRQAELALSYTKIVAPEDGKVTRKSVESGQYVQVGQNLLAVVPHNVWVTANFKETQLTQMRPGQEAFVYVDAFPGHAFKAKVDSIQKGTGARFSLLPPENATGNWVKVVQRVPVKIVFTQPDAQVQLLGPGMSVDAEVKVQ